MLKKANIPVAIIGAGVMGLTCGVKLLKRGYTNITIFAEDISPNTTSDVAGAIWMPFGVGPEARVINGAKRVPA